MDGHDGGDDGQAEADPVAGAVGTGEAFERQGRELDRQVRPSSLTSSTTPPGTSSARRVTVPLPWRSAFSTRFWSA